MSFKFLRIKINQVVTLLGREYPIGEIIEISDDLRFRLASNDEVLLAICLEKITVMDGSGEIKSTSSQINYLKDF